MKFIIAGVLASSIVLLLLGVAVNYTASAPPPGPLWKVTGSIGTHHMLVVDVTAHPSASLREIGESVVKPVIGQFDEV